MGAAHVERFQETTALENYESYTTGYTTAMMLVCLVIVLGLQMNAGKNNRIQSSAQEINRLDELS